MKTELTGRRRLQGVVGSWPPPAAAPSTNEREAGGGPRTGPDSRPRAQRENTRPIHTNRIWERLLTAGAGRRVGALCLLLDSAVNLKPLSKIVF